MISMNKTQHIEDYLSGSLSPEEHLLMEARLLTEPGLHHDVLWQSRSYELIKAYGRQQLRAEIRRAEARLFTESRFNAFQRRISDIFKR